jgi:hypothetical protein
MNKRLIYAISLFRLQDLSSVSLYDWNDGILDLKDWGNFVEFPIHFSLKEYINSDEIPKNHCQLFRFVLFSIHDVPLKG